MSRLTAITVYMVIHDCGDGTAEAYYYLDEATAEECLEGESGILSGYVESIETFIGSNIHLEAT